ncbi:MAG: PP2C family protein-serine/threonine phosphatase [Planctomycetaceae bacterium]
MPLSERDTVEYPAPVRAKGAALQPDATIRFGAATHPGKLRPTNEDHYAVVRRTRAREILSTNVDTTTLNLPDDYAHVLGVADGIGGQNFGELASDLVLRLGWELAGEEPRWFMKFDPADWPKIRRYAEEFVKRLQTRLRDQIRDDEKLAGMGTTWTCLYIMGTNAILAHVGDSRAYLFRGKALQQLSRDHTLAQAMQDRGMPPAATDQFKHILTSSFGTHEEPPQVQVEHFALEFGDRLLVCTDGLSDMAPDAEIARILATIAEPQAACDELIELALRRGGKDNVTVALAEIVPAADAPAT